MPRPPFNTINLDFGVGELCDVAAALDFILTPGSNLDLLSPERQAGLLQLRDEIDEIITLHDEG